MKITMGPGKGKKTEVTKRTFDSPSGRESDNVTMVKTKTSVPGVKKWKRL
jgi:hypothetical protein